MNPEWHLGPTAVRAAYRASAFALVDVVGRIPKGSWERTGLGVWTVRDLVGHAGRALSVTEAYLDTPPGDRDPNLSHPIDYYRAIAASAHADHEAVAERGRQAGRDLGPDPRATLSSLADRVLKRVAREPDDASVATPFGTMTLVDYLPSRVFELTVHRLDVVTATGIDDAGGSPGIALSLVLAAGIAGERSDAGRTLAAITGRRQLPRGFSVI